MENRVKSTTDEISPPPRQSDAHRLVQVADSQPIRDSDEFYVRYKDWVDEQNRRSDEHGLWDDELRRW